MNLRSAIRLTFALLLLTAYCYSQDPMPVLKSSWDFTVQRAGKVEIPTTGPAKQIMKEDLVLARTAREFSTDHPEDPSAQTPDGRRAAIEKNEQDARITQTRDVKGFAYTATVRNDSSKTVKVIYWEYRFTELANPANKVRRQFLCSVSLKKGAELELGAFSTLGPSDTIDVKSLIKSDGKLFNEKVLINRIEYSEGPSLNRGNWELAEVQSAVDRVTSTPWGKERCRAL